MKELRNLFLPTSPDTMSKPRTIPKDSKVRRRLFADDEPEKQNDNHNMIDSMNDVDRILNEDAFRAAVRFEPLSRRRAWHWGLPSIPDYDTRKRRIYLNLKTSQPSSCVLDDERSLAIIKFDAANDNTANSLMDVTRPCYAESVQHWNFDFDKKKPSEGPVEWKQIGKHWVGNMPRTSTRVVMYPDSEAEKDQNNSNPQDEATNKKEAKAEENNQYDEKEIESLITEYAHVIYGDWNKEIKTGIKTVAVRCSRRYIDGEMLNNMYMLQAKNEHRQISKKVVMNMITQDIAYPLNEATIENDETTSRVWEANSNLPNDGMFYQF